MTGEGVPRNDARASVIAPFSIVIAAFSIVIASEAWQSQRKSPSVDGTGPREGVTMKANASLDISTSMLN